MDSIEDFQMKPLTKGLGFHKKPMSLKDQVEKSAIAKDAFPKTVPQPPHKDLLDPIPKVEKPQSYDDLLKKARGENETTEQKKSSKIEKQKQALDKLTFQSDLDFTDAFPRPGDPKNQSLSTGAFGDPTIAFGSTPAAALNFPADIAAAVRRGAADSPPTQKLDASAFCWPSVVIDGLVVVSIALIFLISLVLITKVDLGAIVGAARGDQATRISLALLYLAVYQMYVVVSRSFFGRTLGEWTFDHQLGMDDQHNSATYPLRVVLRSLLVIGTGIVVLPLISTILRKDIAGRITGIELFQQRI